MPMDITELKSKKIAELNQIAKDMNIAGYSDLRKQELIFKILEAQTTKDGLTFSKGVLEVLPDGYGFLRSVNLPAGERDRLLALVPEGYTGDAAQLARQAADSEP